MAWMGLSTKTGYMSRCRAKDPSHCRFHAPESHVQYDESAMEAFNERKSKDDALGALQDNGHKLRKKNHTGNDSPRDNDSTEDDPRRESAVNTERITTLLTDNVPLKDDRTGKVPELKSDDTVVSGLSKLGKYIENNYDGDVDGDSTIALSNLYGKHVTKNDGDVPQSVHWTLIDMNKNPKSDPHVYKDEDGEWYIVTRKTPGKWLKAYAQYRRSGIKVHMVNLGSMIATSQAISKIPFHVIDDDEDQRRFKYEIVGSILNRSKRTIINKGITDDMRGPKELNKFLSSQGESALPDYENRAFSEIRREYDNAHKRMLGNWYDLKNREDFDLFEIDRERKMLPYAMTNANEHVMSYLSDTLDDERNGELNRAYSMRINAQHSATVFEDKKNIDDDHLRAAGASVFRKDFAHIEIDDSVDLDKLRRISGEYDAYRSRLPKARVRADFRFRKTGRHHALGVYTPRFVNIAVDPRSPSAFTHEYMHHLDFTQDSGGHQLSMRPEFRSIIKDYQASIDRTQAVGTNIDNYIAPTEIFARAGELWMHWRNQDDGIASDSSFTATTDEYDHKFDYEPLLKHKNEIMGLFNGLFSKQD